MIIGLINAFFQTGLSHNNTLLSFSYWIFFIILTLFLFFKFTSLKEKESELEYFEKYQAKKEKDYVIVEVVYLPKSKKIASIGLYFYENDFFQKCYLIPFNRVNAFDYDAVLKNELLVFKDYESYLEFKKLYSSLSVVVLSAEYYNLTLKHSISLDNMLNDKKILVSKDTKIHQYIEDNYNKFFVRNYFFSEIEKLNALYLYFRKRGNHNEKTS